MTESVSRESSTSADVDRYEYSSLSGPNDIRCLILKSGSGSEPLSCQLRHIKLGEGVPFEAISYVWGSRVMDYNILCDSRRVDITANLHHSLRQTRLSTRDRVLWADSICINQDNNEEKGHQVRLMGRIYSQAKRVLITLGQDERSNLYSKSAASAIRETSSRVLQTLATLDGGWNSFPFTENDDPLLSDPRWLAIEQLTAHPWFKRGWVIQEAALATEAFILWGHEEITWFEFMRMYSWSFLRARKIHHEYKFVVSGLHLGLYGLRFPNESTSYLRQESPYMRHSLDVLQASRELELDDDKDHVYAFLALPQTAGLKNLQISYDKTASDVYRDVAIWYAEKEKELLFLHYVENNENDLDSDYPSWIPQWHYCRYTVVPNQRDNSYITSHVSGDVFAQVIQSKILQTRGLTFDAIAFTSQTFSGDTTLDELGSVWVSISQYRHRWAYPGSYLFTAFFNTIVAGLIPPDINNASLDAHVRAIMPRLTGGW
ncbi:Heterokaryon incompatibility protein 6, OR allele [Cytospora mali]|uniref:Heterokaryon incompatibility protein 6, OR allele n=1 Tax=Cytospora mali TaxID=578113 RepID=A0A194W3A1_CYTMA|nr:Heterokaryon incompatibility protein 6, OR allele [Valsa mali]